MIKSTAISDSKHVVIHVNVCNIWDVALQKPTLLAPNQLATLLKSVWELLSCKVLQNVGHKTKVKAMRNLPLSIKTDNFCSTCNL